MVLCCCISYHCYWIALMPTFTNTLLKTWIGLSGSVTKSDAAEWCTLWPRVRFGLGQPGLLLNPLTEAAEQPDNMSNLWFKSDFKNIIMIILDLFSHHPVIYRTRYEFENIVLAYRLAQYFQTQSLSDILYKYNLAMSGMVKILSLGER